MCCDLLICRQWKFIIRNRYSYSMLCAYTLAFPFKLLCGTLCAHVYVWVVRHWDTRASSFYPPSPFRATESYISCESNKKKKRINFMCKSVSVWCLLIWVFVVRRAISPFNDICHRFEMEIGTGRGGASLCVIYVRHKCFKQHICLHGYRTKQKRNNRTDWGERKRNERTQVMKKAQ